MFKRRSAHGIFSSPKAPAISSPTNFVKISPGGIGDSPPAFNSAMPDTKGDEPGAGDCGTVDNAIAHQFQTVQAYESSTVQEGLQTPSSERRLSFQPLASHPVPSSSDEDTAPPPPDFTRRGIHIPTRTSSSSKSAMKRRFLRTSSNPPPSAPTTPESQRARSSADSVISYETTASSIQTQALAPLQQKGPLDDFDRLSPLLEDDPKSFDLVAPPEHETGKVYSLETQSEKLFSKEHLEAIFHDTPSLLRFTSFLSVARPKSIPVLIYYLDALKALRAINYANAVAEALEPIEGHEFTDMPARPTVNAILEERARQAFDILVQEDLPAFVAHVFIQVVSVSIQKRVTGNLPPLLREASEGLAEVFCVSDPSRSDNPIIFASEEFHRTTQYGVNYAIGRNCRFLQGPKTNRHSIDRLRQAIKAGKETSEVFLNYRRDGSPFMNLLMMAPLLDSRGNLRYFIGAQVDVSGLVKDATDLDAFQQMLEKQHNGAQKDGQRDEFQELSEMFNNAELDTVRKFGGSMHREHLEEDDTGTYHRPRLLLSDNNAGGLEAPLDLPAKAEGRLCGVYKHYLLIRPYPSLRVLFTSPSLRVPGILQSRFLDRIGGSTRVRDSLAEALADGTRGVTAKIRWLSSAATELSSDHAEEGRPRWIHCTPLLGQSGAVGVWMVILVDDEKAAAPVRRFRQAPPVAPNPRQQRQPRHVASSSFTQDIEDTGSDREHERDSSPDTPRRRSGQSAQALRSMGLDVRDMQRPRSVMSEQRAEPSIKSFALG